MELKAKFVLIGDSEVGKTAIITRYKDNEFSPLMHTTVGNINTDKILVVNKKRINLAIWDTAGQERFRDISAIHYRDAQIIALVYDVNSESSMHNLQYWMDRIQELTNSEHSIILVGNKIDKVDEEELEIDENVQEIIDEYNLQHIFTSAKDGRGITEMFQKAVKEADQKGIIERFNEKTEVDIFKIDHTLNQQQKDSRGCCQQIITLKRAKNF